MKKKVATLLMAPVLLLGTAIGAYAADGFEQIDALLNHNLKFKLNGTAWKPKTDDGLNIAPITYDGTTYLPVRAVAEALKVAVDYDGETGTVLLGEKPEGTPIVAHQVDYSAGIKRTKEKDKTIKEGVDYKEVFYSPEVSDYFGESLTFYPEKEHQKLYLQVLTLDQDLRVIAYDGDTEILDYKVKKNSEPETVVIEVGGLESVYVEIKSNRQNETTEVIIPAASYYK